MHFNSELSSSNLLKLALDFVKFLRILPSRDQSLKLFFIGILFAMSSFKPFQDDTNNHTIKSVVILIGPPGCGKGTQAAKLTGEIGIPHISTGDLFRENIANDTELGRQAKTYMNEGKLAPDSLVLDMLFDRITKEDCSKGYLLDGFPRTLPQAEAFNARVLGDSKLLVINLSTPDELIVKRIEGRRTCKKCSQIYNIYYSPPKTKDVCDLCHGELYQRPDDAATIVQERLRVYSAQTEPLIGYYSQQGVLMTVNGDAPPDDVYKQIIKIYRETTAG